MAPVYVSYFTASYAREAAALVESLREHCLDRDVREVPDCGSWLKNIHHKAKFLRQMREQYPRRPVVWVDADARIVSEPKLFDRIKADFAGHYFRGRQLCGGTLFLAPTEASYELLRRWEWRIEHYGREQSDQTSLQVEADAMPGLSIHELPPEYCFIHDLSAEAYPGVEPVILHGQASRVRA